MLFMCPCVDDREDVTHPPSSPPEQCPSPSTTVSNATGASAFTGGVARVTRDLLSPWIRDVRAGAIAS
ncbi:BnaC02g29820D [Brassica napus]|uniref:BnaC02g29820D protein n=2 Tax=Brassica TaxID=3705 RepID=A0A078FF03_BRANA|nr:BnaC02g29820D [Brassica napus]